MNILFVYKGRYYVRDAITVEYLSAISKRLGHKAALVYDEDTFGVTDNVFSSGFLNKAFSADGYVFRSIVSSRYDLVVFIDGFNRRAWNNAMAAKVKGSSIKGRTVLLAHSLSDTMDGSYDHILEGEPEFSFERFLKEGGINSPVPRLKYEGLVNLDSLPLPDKDLFRPYVNFRDSYMVYTSKGCPYSCSYCEETIYKSKAGQAYCRRRRPDIVLSELELAKSRFGSREVIFKDSVFALNKEWLKAFLGGYKKVINLPYKCFGKAETFDEEMAAMLKESGCYCVEFGVQTFNESLKQELLGRDEKTASLLKAFSICDHFHLRYDADHLFGIPKETISDHKSAAAIYSGLKYLNRIKCHNLVFYPEAPIFKSAPDEIRSNPAYSADFFSTVYGQGGMRVPNRLFEKYFRVLPLLSGRAKRYLANGDSWKAFSLLSGPIVLILMVILAYKNRDRRFAVYLKNYPARVIRAMLKSRGEVHFS